jgi:transglutaminase-like putative cysteine protease
LALRPIPDGIQAFLLFDDIVDMREDISETAASVVDGLASDIERARALYEWVRDSIPHSRDVDRDEVTCSATEVYDTGTGICYAKAHLLASMMRSQGIPCGFCYQVFESPTSKVPDSLALHGLNGVYLSSLERWIRVDPRGNGPEVHAEFSVEEEKLAWPELEMLDDNVYAKPLEVVAEALTRYTSRTDLWPYLPSVKRT